MSRTTASSDSSVDGASTSSSDSGSESEVPPPCARCFNYRTNAMMAYRAARGAHDAIAKNEELSREVSQLQRVLLEQQNYNEELLRSNQALEAENENLKMFLRQTEDSCKLLQEKVAALNQRESEAVQSQIRLKKMEEMYEELQKLCCEQAEKRKNITKKYGESCKLLKLETERRRRIEKELETVQHYYYNSNNAVPAPTQPLRKNNEEEESLDEYANMLEDLVTNGGEGADPELEEPRSRKRKVACSVIGTASPSMPAEVPIRTTRKIAIAARAIRKDEVVTAPSTLKPLTRRQEIMAKVATGVSREDVIDALAAFIDQSATSHDQAKLFSVLEPYRDRLNSVDITRMVQDLVTVILRMGVGDLRSMLRRAAEKGQKRGVVLGVRETIVFEFVNYVQSIEGFKDFCYLLYQELLVTLYKTISPTVHQFSKVIRCLCFSYLLTLKINPERELELKPSLKKALKSVLKAHNADLVVPGICYATTILHEHLKDVYFDPSDTFYWNLLRIHVATSPEQAKLLFQLAEVYIGEGITEDLSEPDSEEVAEWVTSLFDELVSGGYSKELIDQSLAVYRLSSDVVKVNIAKDLFTLSSQALNDLNEDVQNMTLANQCKLLLFTSSRVIAICGAERNDPSRKMHDFLCDDIVNYTKEIFAHLDRLKSCPTAVEAMRYWLKSIQPLTRIRIVP